MGGDHLESQIGVGIIIISWLDRYWDKEWVSSSSEVGSLAGQFNRPGRTINARDHGKTTRSGNGHRLVIIAKAKKGDRM